MNGECVPTGRLTVSPTADESLRDPAAGQTNDLTMRPITGCEELDLSSQLPYFLNEELVDDLARGRRRPEWMRVALRGDRLLATAAWRS
ncbi:hypothetical protein [Streptomyces caniferus]|uniref:hypothetical protein n=1 Tax=Streptomyces caniferus TaxID=285557 RepID=UPI00381A78AE